jgi:flagellar biosynthetic protein FliR
MNATVPQDLLLSLLLAAVRAAAWIAICPPFSTRAIPRTVKAGLSLALALPMAQAGVGGLPEPQIGSVVLAVLSQVAVGLALGLVTLIVLSAVQAAGDVIDLFGSFSIAAAYDPMTQNQTAVFGRFNGLLLTVLLFATGGHLLLLRGFLHSYEVVPLDGMPSVDGLSDLFLRLVGGLFLSALQIAAPLVAASFLADIALGLLTRTAPSLNIFSLGFPVKIALTLLMVGVTLPLLPGVVDGLVGDAVGGMLELTGG